MTTKFQMDFVQFLLYFVIITGLILFFLLLYYRRQYRGSKWLAFFILAFPLNFLNYTLVLYLYRNFEGFTLMRIPVLYSLGLLFWLYVQSILRPTFCIRAEHWWIFMPFILDVLYSFGQAVYIRFWILPMKQELLFQPVEFLIHEGGSILYNFSFLLAAFFQSYRLKKHIAKKKKITPDLSAQINWVQQICFVFFVLSFTHQGYYIAELILFPKYVHFHQYYPLWLMEIFIILLVGYKSILQPHVVFYKNEVAKEIKPKYQHSNLKLEEITQLSEQLKKLMEEEQLFLDAQLKLADLSNALSIQPHQLSQVISQGLNSNFYDFINHYRIELVKKRLIDQKHLQENILTIAYNAGFNSKTAFNMAFRKFTNTSPSAYRKQFLNTIDQASR